MVSQSSEDAAQGPVFPGLQVWAEVQKIMNAQIFLLGRKQLAVYTPQLLDMPEGCGPYLDLTLLAYHMLSSGYYGGFTKHSPVCKLPEALTVQKPNGWECEQCLLSGSRYQD